MSKSIPPSRVRATYEFIKVQSASFPVQVLCRVLEVAPSGYYAWLKQPLSNRAQEDARLLRLIRASFIASQGIYGAPRVFLDLREAGETCSKHRVARLMRENQLRALHGYRTRRWSVGKPAVLIPNLLQRRFTVSRPNRVWVTDITYVRTWQGWLYVAVVMDLFSRKIVGWAARPTIHRELCLDAVLMAVRAPTRTRHADTFRSRHPVRVGLLAPLLPVASARAQHESQGQLLGQRRSGGLLRQSEEGTDQEADLQVTPPRNGRHRSIHRDVLQSLTASQPPWWRQP